MTLEYATISGQILDLTGDALPYAPLFIQAATNGGVIKDTIGAVLFSGTRQVNADGNGNYTVTLPKVPQADVDPGDARYRLIRPTSDKVYDLGPGWTGLAPEPIEFTLTADTTWAALVDVSGTPVVAGLVAQLTALRDETVAAAGAVAYTQTRLGLRRYYEHLAKRSSRRINILVIGDSIDEGGGVSSPAYQKRSIDLTQKQLRARLGLAAGGVGYMPSMYAGALMADDTTRTGTAPTELDWIYGPGGKTVQLVGNTGSPGALSWPAITCDKIRVHYGRTDFLGGNFKVFIDAVDVTSAGTLGGNGTSGASGATVTNSTGGGAKAGGYYWESAALSLASHTLKVQANVNGFVSPVTAAEFFSGDNASGVHIIDAAHTGGKASAFIQASMNPGWDEITTHNADLTIINLGSNESFEAVPAGTFQADLTSLVGKVKTSAPSGAILIVHGWRIGTVAQGVWDDYATAARAVADAEPLATYLDLAQLWMPLTTDGAQNNGLMWESTNPIHPNTEGNQRLADIFTSLLLPT